MAARRARAVRCAARGGMFKCPRTLHRPALVMKNFRCACGNMLYFENTRCLVCGRQLGFVPRAHVLTALEKAGPELWRALHPAIEDARQRLCANYTEHQVCNWLVPESDPHPYCESCRLNRMIPDLSEPNNRVLWRRIEDAKRRLLYSLHALRLPVIGRDVDAASGLAFEFLADQRSDLEFSDNFMHRQRVMTGHRAGIITINIAEADPSAREQMRERMNEGYRTLLGHFRHEIGHYYWDRLVRREPGRLGEFRERFGDERTDYAAAAHRYYVDGPPSDWQSYFISAYGACHPWEDWSETWAHYMHMVDTLETSSDYGFALHGVRVLSLAERTSACGTAASAGNTDEVFAQLLVDWEALALAMNSLNRSMGLPDPYPFSVSAVAAAKLRFVHDLIGSVT